MKPGQKRRLIAGVTSWLAFSAALAYWITHDRHRLVREIVPPTNHPKTYLDKNDLFYCPVCGEPVRLDPSPLSLRVAESYRIETHLRAEVQNTPQWKRSDDDLP